MRRVIVVTDGDCKALAAVEKAAANVGARCISLTGCRNPRDARWTPDEVEELILSTPHDPVVVLVDDEGRQGEGWGERVVRHLVGCDKVDVVGVVAVASDLTGGNGIKVNASITADGRVVTGPVDKSGHESGGENAPLRGDTVENLQDLGVPYIVGIGDPGKMAFADDVSKGAPLTTKALELVLRGR